MKKCISVAFIVVFLISLQTVIEACRSVSGCKVIYDPRCSTGERSFGCNAGGQGKIKIQIIFRWTIKKELKNTNQKKCINCLYIFRGLGEWSKMFS